MREENFVLQIWRMQVQANGNEPDPMLLQSLSKPSMDCLLVMARLLLIRYMYLQLSCATNRVFSDHHAEALAAKGSSLLQRFAKVQVQAEFGRTYMHIKLINSSIIHR